MSHYSLQQAATLLSTGRTTLCQQLRERGILTADNLPAREHVSAGRFAVRQKQFLHIGLGQNKPYGKTIVTDQGLRWLSGELNRQLVTQREAANDPHA